MSLLPALSLLLAGPALAAGSPPELRGLWVVRTALVSPQAVDRMVDEARAAGFNALFVQVRGRGDAFYDSRLVGRSPLLANQPRGFDPLARLLERARAAGLDVHAWVNVLLTAHFGLPLYPEHVLRVHPEWLMVPRAAAGAALLARTPGLPRLVAQAARGDGDVEGYYLSPSAPGVPEHLEQVVRELLLRYPVQGLHLDFIRYPGPDYDYSRAALEGFRRRHGGGGELLTGPARNPEAWDHYRRDVLSALASRLVAAARLARPEAIVSAAVVADATQAVARKYQSWPAWMSEGLLDAVCPMVYTPDSQLFRQQLEQVRSRVKPGQAVWAGIGAYRLPFAGIVERIRLARELGAAGVLLFSYDSLAPADLRRLREAAFPLAATAAVPRGAGEAAGLR